MKKLLIKTILFVIVLNFASCSKDDDDQTTCLETNVTMFINGKLETFQALGSGIDLMQDGYRLQINLYKGNDTPYKEENIVVSLPFKKTGKNIIEQFTYRQNTNQVSFEGDFLDGKFDNNVIINTKNCFYATFSGKLNDGNQEIIITAGKLSYKYKTPFEE